MTLIIANPKCVFAKTNNNPDDKAKEQIYLLLNKKILLHFLRTLL